MVRVEDSIRGVQTRARHEGWQSVWAAIANMVRTRKEGAKRGAGAVQRKCSVWRV